MHFKNPNAIYHGHAKDLVRVRERAGLTAQQLSARAGVSRQIISAFEADRRAVVSRPFIELANALDCDVAVFLVKRRS